MTLGNAPKRRKIILVNCYFYKDTSATSQMLSDLAWSFCLRHFDQSLTTVPRDVYQSPSDRAAWRLNEAKHVVTFGMASDAFDDPNGYDWYDEDNSNYEHRYRLLGMVEGRLIFVAFTYRDHRVRIISAREADENEQEEYRIYNQG